MLKSTRPSTSKPTTPAMPIMMPLVRITQANKKAITDVRFCRAKMPRTNVCPFMADRNPAKPYQSP